MYRWLKRLKPGDPVVVFHSRFGYKSYELKEVERLTPSGIIVVNGLHYRPTDGQLRGSDDAWGITELLNYQDPAVKEKLLKYSQQKYVNSLCGKFGKITSEIDLINDIAFYSEMNGADYGGSYDCSLEEMRQALTKWLEYKNITNEYTVKMIKRADPKCGFWRIYQIVQKGGFKDDE